MISKLLKNLNKEQKEAVLQTNGPILILAGAGSGKTRVLTTKIAYLVEEMNVREDNILAFTFTNKAAKEMKERISLTLNKNVDHMWIGTFHSICSRILRKNIERIGFKSNFTIYDTQDSKTLIKEIMKDLKIDEKTLSVSNVIGKVSDYKNRFVNWEEVAENSIYESQKNIAEIYKQYEKRKKANNALDFDDLILKTLELLRNSQDVREYYADLFEYVFVDEYQDTNKSQYELIKLLSYKYRNICVVGDGDQSIYSWRGADITNILNFESDFKNARIILLEQNYRSTTKILDAANQLIRNNIERKDKNLWTENSKGKDIVFRLSKSEYEEAQDVINKIYQMKNYGFAYKDMAILYRTNAQSRIFEEKLMAEKIPHKVVGGLKFYDRREVKDLLAYLSFIANPDDDLSLKRIINMPKRGIGDTTVGKIEKYAQSKDQSMYDSIYDEDISEIVPKTTLNKVKTFLDEMTNFINMIEDYDIKDLAVDIYQKSGYQDMLEKSSLIEDKSRIENISSLITAITEFSNKNPDSNLYDYLQNVSLLSDVDKTDDSEGISLMTIHSAKGLEYDVVFLSGMEENLFPSLRTVEEGGLEEERRLCYVAITRAKKQLFISASASRMSYGNLNYSKKSRFIDEIKDHIVDESRRREEIFDMEFDFLENKRNIYKEKVQQRKERFEESKKQEFSIGDKVSHKKFGIGMIVSVSELEHGKELIISFENKGIKKLNSAMAPLKKL
ncbi:MAG: UvrD-helicase domain-containing protein [Tissierellia bacterium]|nr:UvrD-helicase domain-containing protein [Tissierellia bacterium]